MTTTTAITPITDPWAIIAGLASWLDDHSGRTDLQLTLRLLKIQEEAGEVAQAWIGVMGQNPRKGASHTREQVADEVVDVIVTAMVALASLTTDPAGHFARKIQQIAALRLPDVDGAS